MAKRARKAAAAPSSARERRRAASSARRRRALRRRHDSRQLVDIMARLRGPGGCPWDREQTHRVAARIRARRNLRGARRHRSRRSRRAPRRDRRPAVRRRLPRADRSGRGRFTVADSLRRDHRRSSCGAIRTSSADGAAASTHRGPGRSSNGSRSRRANRRTPASGDRFSRALPKTLPAAPARARDRLPRRRGRLRLGPNGGRRRRRSKKRSRRCAARSTAKEPPATEEEIGDLLFSIANLARRLGVEPESALRKANEKFSARFEGVERALEARGRSVHDSSLEEMDAEWERVKARERA